MSGDAGAFAVVAATLGGAQLDTAFDVSALVVAQVVGDVEVAANAFAVAAVALLGGDFVAQACVAVVAEACVGGGFDGAILHVAAVAKAGAVVLDFGVSVGGDMGFDAGGGFKAIAAVIAGYTVAEACGGSVGLSGAFALGMALYGDLCGGATALSVVRFGVGACGDLAFVVAAGGGGGRGVCGGSGVMTTRVARDGIAHKMFSVVRGKT